MTEAIVLQVKATLNNTVVTGLTLSDFSFYLYAKAKSGGAVTTVVNGANAAAADGGGAYSYTYSDPDYETYNYFGHTVYGGASNLDGKLWEFDIREPAKDAIDRYDPPTKTELDTVESNIRGADSDTLETLSDQIDLVNGGGGSETVTITVEDGDSTAIADATVEVWNAANTAIVSSVTTDVSGQAVFYLDDGSYKVRLRKSGVSFDTEDLTVSGTTTATFTGTLLSTTIGSPAAASQCRVYEWCFDADDETALSSVTAMARIIELPYDYNDKLHSGDAVTGTYDSDSGLLYWDLARGAVVLFDIVELRFGAEKTIPAQTTVRLSDI